MFWCFIDFVVQILIGPRLLGPYKIWLININHVFFSFNFDVNLFKGKEFSCDFFSFDPLTFNFLAYF